MRSRSSYLLSAISVLCSCAGSKPGVKYGESPVNTPIPGPFQARSVYPNDFAGGQKFEDLTGAIVVLKKNNDPLLVGLIRPNNFTTSVVPITDPNTYYRSRVQKGAEAQGSYLGFAAGFTADQMAELELVDAAWAGISFPTEAPFDEVLAKAEAWIATHPKTDTASSRIWIKELVLTRRVYTAYAKIKSDATGVVGPAVGVKTGVYNNSDTHTKSVIYGLVAFDIDKMVSQAKAVEGLAGRSAAVLSFSGFPSTEITGTIKDETN